MNSRARTHGSAIACAILVLALVLPAFASARFEGNLGRATWCLRLSGDSVCSWRGKVRAADRVAGVLAPEQLLPPHQSRLIGSEGTRVGTGRNAVAHVLFRGRARCTLGGQGQPGDYFTHASEETLFNQYLGYSSCSSLRGRAPREAGVLCSESEEPCPATIGWTGTFFTKTVASEATASIVDTYTQRQRIVVCSGSIRVRVEDERSSAEASGGASGNSRYVIVIEEVRTTTYEEDPDGTSTATGTSNSVSIVAEQHQRGRGACESSSISEQEHTVTP